LSGLHNLAKTCTSVIIPPASLEHHIETLQGLVNYMLSRISSMHTSACGLPLPAASLQPQSVSMRDMCKMLHCRDAHVVLLSQPSVSPVCWTGTSNRAVVPHTAAAAAFPYRLRLRATMRFTKYSTGPTGMACTPLITAAAFAVHVCFSSMSSTSCPVL